MGAKSSRSNGSYLSGTALVSRQQPPIAGIILAAGMSTRFGGNKLVAELDRVPIIRRVAETALASGLQRIVAVLGHEHSAVRSALGDLPGDERLEMVINEGYRQGQSSSVIAGLRALEADFSAAMYLMGDQPRLSAGIIDGLIDAFQNSEKNICYPSFQNRRRNPVIFGERFYADILALTGDTGARAIIDANPEDALAVAFEKEHPFLDVDEAGDLNLLHGAGKVC